MKILVGELAPDAGSVTRTGLLGYCPQQPEIAALSMSGSSLLVAVNALLPKRLRLPSPAGQPAA